MTCMTMLRANVHPWKRIAAWFFLVLLLITRFDWRVTIFSQLAAARRVLTSRKTGACWCHCLSLGVADWVLLWVYFWVLLGIKLVALVLLIGWCWRCCFRAVLGAVQGCWGCWWCWVRCTSGQSQCHRSKIDDSIRAFLRFVLAGLQMGRHHSDLRRWSKKNPFLRL